MQPRTTLLLVEDDQLVLLHATMALEDAGYAVVAVPSAEAALASLHARDDIAALLTDIELAGEADGIALAHAARAVRPEMPIVVTSGRHALAENAMPEGGTFVPKPYTAEQLRDVLAGAE